MGMLTGPCRGFAVLLSPKTRLGTVSEAVTGRSVMGRGADKRGVGSI